MIKECWDEQPERRLTFSQICDALSKVQKGKKTNIVDNMMKMLEEYSNHLEDIVKARTAELEVEKKKSQELLARMMPVEIAQRLQNGETILPGTKLKILSYRSIDEKTQNIYRATLK